VAAACISTLPLVDQASYQGNVNPPAQREIVKVTALAGSTYTIQRGLDGTAAQIWSAGAVIDNRLTALALSDIIFAGGGAPAEFKLRGDRRGCGLDFGTNSDEQRAYLPHRWWREQPRNGWTSLSTRLAVHTSAQFAAILFFGNNNGGSGELDNTHDCASQSNVGDLDGRHFRLGCDRKRRDRQRNLVAGAVACCADARTDRSDYFRPVGRLAPQLRNNASTTR